MPHTKSDWKIHLPKIGREIPEAVGGTPLGASRVMVPEDVAIPLPRDTMAQIAIPASVNGRDLSLGRP